MKRKALVLAAAGAAVAAFVGSTGVASANPTNAPSSWGCQVGRPANYSGTAICHSQPNGSRMRVAILCYDGVAGSQFYVYGPWVTSSNKTSAVSCGYPSRDNAELIYASTT
jgi:hypothetical protein